MRRIHIFIASLLFLSCLQSPVLVEEPSPDIQGFINVFEAYEVLCPYFTYKGMDWKAIAEEVYPSAAECESEEAMLETITEMLALLEDPAVFIFEVDGFYNPIDSVYAYSKEYEFNYNMDVLVENYLEPNGWAGWDEGYSEGFGWCDPELLPYAFLDTIPGDSDSIALGSFDAFLAECIELDLPAIIVDVRMNPSGTNSGDQFMGRFTDQIRSGAIYRSRSGSEYDQYFDVISAMHPKGPDQYTGTVILLVGEGCIQGAERVAASLRQLPNFVLIGNTTGGSVSSLSGTSLFGGWYCKVVSTTVLTYEKQWIEGVGIPPDVYVQATEADFAAGVDPVLDYAIEMLDEFAR